MRLSDKPLSVVVNPFAAPLNHQGRAMALVTPDPSEPSGTPHIGVRIVPGAKTKRPGNPFGDSPGKIGLVYDLKPIKISDTAYHRTLLSTGQVFEAEGADGLARLLQSAEGGDGKLLQAANAALEVCDVPREQVIATWLTQGLEVVALAVAPDVAKSLIEARAQKVREEADAQKKSKASDDKAVA